MILGQLRTGARSTTYAALSTTITSYFHYDVFVCHCIQWIHGNSLTNLHLDRAIWKSWQTLRVATLVSGLPAVNCEDLRTAAARSARCSQCPVVKPRCRGKASWTRGGSSASASKASGIPPTPGMPACPLASRRDARETRQKLFFISQ